VVTAEAGGVGATLAAGGASGSWLGPVGILVGIAITGIVLGGIYVATKGGSDKGKPAAVVTDRSSSDSDSSSSDSASSSDRDTSASASDSSSSDSSIDLAGVYVITENTDKFSSGAPSPDDPLGCAGRRVPDKIQVSRGRPNQVFLNYPDEPGSPSFEHDGSLESDGSFQVDFPDASGTNIEGRFETHGSEIDIADGQLFSGDCTFFFTGVRQ
jgi:hypothetical protein